MKTILSLLALSLTLCSSLPALAIPTTTAGDFTASWTHNSFLTIDGPFGPETFALGFPIDTFRDQALNAYGQYVFSAESTNDGFTRFAIYGYGGATKRTGVFFSGETATGNFGSLTWDYPRSIGDVESGTYAEFNGYLNYVYAGPPTASGLVTAIAQAGYVGTEFVIVDQPVHWFLPPSPFSPTPEPSSWLLLLSAGLGLWWRKRGETSSAVHNAKENQWKTNILTI